MNPYFTHGSLDGVLGFGFLGGMFGAGVAITLIILVLWELVWKGLALWHAAKNGEKVWFVVFLLVHTLGILEIVYLFGFRADRHTSPIFSSSKPGAAPAEPSSPSA